VGELVNHTNIKNVFLNFQGTEEQLEDYVEKEGIAFLERLEGTFGHAYERHNKIKAFTDWVGQYPLYFLLVKDKKGDLKRVIFANDITTLLSDLDYAYKNVYRVPPSHLVTIDSEKGDIEFQRYYTLPRYSREEVIEKVGRKIEEIGMNYRKILYEEVEKRLPPVGTKIGLALGGIDSLQVLKILLDLRPNDVISYNIEGEDTPRSREVAAILGVDLREIRIPKGELLENDHRLINDILDNIEDFDSLDVYTGFACYLIYKAMHRDGIEVVAIGNGGNEWSGKYTSSKWFQIDQDSLLEISARRRLASGYPPTSGFYHQQLGGALTKGLSVYDLKLAHKFGIDRAIEPLIGKTLMEFALNIPPDYFRFGRDEINNCFSGLVKTKLLSSLDYIPKGKKGEYIIARLPVVYHAFKNDIPEVLIPVGGSRFYDSVGITGILDSIGGDDYILRRFNTRYKANESRKR